MEYSLRALAGKSFHAVKFSAAEFSAPFASCTLCGKHIVENPADEEAAGGYVRLNVIEQAGDGSEYLQWDWVCEECLGRFRDLAGWKILPGPVDLGTHARFRRFKERVAAEREKDAPLPGARFDLEVAWSPEEVVAVAGARGRVLPMDEATRLLWRNRRRLTGAMDAAALQVIVSLISGGGPGE